MKRIAFLLLLLSTAAPAQSQTDTPMTVQRSGSTPAIPGPDDWFTGSVRIENSFEAPAPARVRGSVVTFEPGARTAWHTHPLGQTLVVTAGVGWVQHEGGPVEEIRPGDTVWIAPNERHWHGATATNGMTHVAIYEALGTEVVVWMEHVTDEQYKATPSAP